MPNTVVVVFAHPDDAEFYAAGQVLRWVEEGRTVHYLCATSGEIGTLDENLTRGELAKIREDEQRAAADILGVQEVRFLRLPDGAVEVAEPLVEQITAFLRQVCADWVATFDSLSHDAFDLHPDHQAVALCAARACAKAELRLYEAGSLPPRRIEKVFLFASPRPDYHFDAREVLEKKVEALRAHASQWSFFRDLKRVNYAKYLEEPERYLRFEPFRVVTSAQYRR